MRALVVVSALAGVATPCRAQSPAPEDSVVLIRANTVFHHARGSGFLVGDGSWVVTASHVVSMDLGKGNRLSDQSALVYVPWTGRPYEAKVVAVDGLADIALLRLPQAGFPALPIEGLDLTDANAAKAALEKRPIRLYGFPLTYGEATVASLAKAEKNDSQLAEIAKKGDVNLCVLQKCPDAQPGWSGGPIVAADKGAVVGVFHSLYQRPNSSEGLPTGSLCGYLGRLLQSAGAKDLAPFAKPPAPTVPHPKEAGERLALELRSIAWSAAGNWKKAEEEQRDLLKLAPEDPLALLELAMILLARKQDDAALKAAEQAARLAPRSYWVNLNLARVRDFNYDTTGAIQALKTAIEVAPEDVEPHLALARIHESARKLDEAEAALKAALQVSKEHPAAIYQLGSLLLGVPRRGEEALNLLAQAGDLAQYDSGFVAVTVGYARALEAAGKVREAEGRYRLAIKQDPQYSLAYYYLAQFFFRNRRYDDAQVQLNVGINLPNLSDEQTRAFQALQVLINEKSDDQS